MDNYINPRESYNIGVDNKALNEQKRTYDKGLQSSLASTTNPFNTPDRDNYRTYPYDFFSGTDCKVFFGDIWVDDIITIQYSVSQTKTPIFGYASQYYQGVAMGQVLVNGVLTIAFKEVGYLNSIIGLLEAQRNRSEASINQKVNKIKQDFNETTTPFIPGVTSIGGSETRVTSVNYNPNGSPDIIRSQDTIESILMNKKGISSNFTMDYLGNKKEMDFEDIAEALEDTIWGDKNGEPYDSSKLLTRLKRADEFDYTYSSKNGGVSPNSDFPMGIKVPEGHDYSGSLNLLLTFGDINDYRAEHTLIALNDVHFTGQTAVYAPDGNPIAEQYTFFAREINRNLGSKTFNINPLKLKIGADSITLSKCEDVEKLGEQLSRESELTSYKIQSISRYDSSWHSYTAYEGKSYIVRRPELPYIDQLISDVEQLINNPILGSSETKKKETEWSGKTSNIVLPIYNKQYVFGITFLGSDGSVKADGQMTTIVVNQAIANTYTFRVVSPTRTNFSSFSTITREDLWTTAAPPVKNDDPTLSSKPETKKEIEKQTQQMEDTSIQSENTPSEQKSDMGFVGPPTSEQLQAGEQLGKGVLANNPSLLSAEETSKKSLVPPTDFTGTKIIDPSLEKNDYSNSELGKKVGESFSIPNTSFNTTTSTDDQLAMAAQEGIRQGETWNPEAEFVQELSYAPTSQSDIVSDAMPPAMLFPSPSTETTQPDIQMDEFGNYYSKSGSEISWYTDASGTKTQKGPTKFPKPWEQERARKEGLGLGEGVIAEIRGTEKHEIERPHINKDYNTFVDIRANQGDIIPLRSEGTFVRQTKDAAFFQTQEGRLEAYIHVQPTNLQIGQSYPIGTQVGSIIHEGSISQAPHLHYQTFFENTSATERDRMALEGFPAAYNASLQRQNQVAITQ